MQIYLFSVIVTMNNNKMKQLRNIFDIKHGFIARK